MTNKPKSKQKSGNTLNPLLVLKNSIYSLLIILSVSLFYFAVLISIKPKSFPIVTKTIENYINHNISYGDEISINNISIGLSSFYKLNIILEEVQLIFSNKNLSIPKVQAQFSLFNIIFNQKPSKIGFENVKLDLNGSLLIDNHETNIDKKDYDQAVIIKKIWNIFLLFDDDKILTNEFEVKNFDISFQNTKDERSTISIKQANIEIDNKDGDLLISIQKDFNLNNNEIDISLDTHCQFNRNKYLKCDAGFFNIVPKSISNLIKGVEFLEKINTLLSINLNLEVDKDYNLSSVLFDANSNKGSFYYKQFFEDRMDFVNLKIIGEIEDSMNNIKISELKVKFDKDVDFTMSMDIQDFRNPNLEEKNMYFRVSNSPGNDITKFWPVFLGTGVRNWVKSHIDKGKIKDAYANVKTKRQNNKNVLSHVDSEILFSGLRLRYNDSMPEIKKIDGVASFTKDNMKIDIVSGKILDSTIKTGKILIDNFDDKDLLLKIHGSILGYATDPVKHINYKGKFAKEIDKYLNGYSDNVFSIYIPLKRNISGLKDLYIKVLSNIKKTNAKFIKNNSNINISTLKDFNSNIFKTKIDFTGSEIDIPIANIKKEKGTISKASLEINPEDNQLGLNKIKWSIDNSTINSDILLSLQPFKIRKAIIQNNYNNDYNLYYETNPNDSSLKMEINGYLLDLESAVNSLYQSKNYYTKNNIEENNEGYNSLEINANLKLVNLSGNQKLNNFQVNLKCYKLVCDNSFIKADSDNNKNLIDLEIYKKSKKHHFTTIKGNISDISLIARALNISDQMIDGKAELDARMFIIGNKISLLKGNIIIDDEFSIIKNEIFKQIIKDKAFEDLRKDIDSSDKIVFHELDLDFKYEEGSINIEKLIANSHLIGFTAKGYISLEEVDTNLKGLIVPGYSLNSLFGIGKIPVLGPIIMGEKGGGIFAARYEYNKNQEHKKGEFNINSASAIIPGSIRNIFDLFD